jgi:signal transduction histidine kinase
LHLSALWARESGGVLRCASDGPGRGATFILELPAPSPVSMDVPAPAAALS